jgi:drug/metabolite transporter (DMT)-like permease
MRPRDVGALFALAAIWGASYLFIRVAVPAYGPVPLVAARVLVAAAVLWTGMRAMGTRPALRAHARALLVLGALNAAAPFTLISAAEQHITASLAAMLTATAPLWGAVFGAWWLGERLTTRRVGGLALGFAGVVVLAGWNPVGVSASTLLAIGAMLVAAAGYASAGVWVKRRLAGVPGPTLALGQQLGAAVWLAVPALWRLPHAHPTAPATLALLALALLSTAVAYLLYFHLIAAIGPTRTTTAGYLIPVFGAAWGALFLGEPVTPAMLGGLALILASVVLVNDVRLGVRMRRTVRAPSPACGAS